MKKKYLLLIILLLLVGCTNKIEEEKKDYLTYKSELQTQDEFKTEEELECTIAFNLERKTEEKVAYNVIISNPKVNMHDIKALLIHDYFTEEIFPSVGIFNDTVNLLTTDSDALTLEGEIQTEKEIKKEDFKLYIEYTDDEGLKNYIYYKMTK